LTGANFFQQAVLCLLLFKGGTKAVGPLIYLNAISAPNFDIDSLRPNTTTSESNLRNIDFLCDLFKFRAIRAFVDVSEDFESLIANGIKAGLDAQNFTICWSLFVFLEKSQNSSLFIMFTVGETFGDAFNANTVALVDAVKHHCMLFILTLYIQSVSNCGFPQRNLPHALGQYARSPVFFCSHT
jgi:hypothetical protein